MGMTRNMSSSHLLQPHWSFVPDVTIKVDVCTDFLRTQLSPLLFYYKWMFSSLSGCYRWTFVATWSFLAFSSPQRADSLDVTISFSSRRGGGGCLSVIQVVSTECLYVLWTFVLYVVFQW